MKFHKYHGLGNDYVIIDPNESPVQLIRSFSLNQYPPIILETIKENIRPLLLFFVKPLIASATAKMSVQDARIEQIQINGTDFEFIVAASRKHNLTINEFFLCALLKTAEEIRERFHKDSSLTGTLFTINLRRYQKNRPITLTNFSGIGTCIVRMKNLQTFARAAKAVGNASNTTCVNGQTRRLKSTVLVKRHINTSQTYQAGTIWQLEQ